MSALLSIFRPQAQASEVTDLQNPALWLREFVLGRRTASGERVTPESAMGLPAYLAALRIVSGDVAKVLKRLHKRRPKRGSDLAVGHPVDRILHDRWNPVMSAFVGWRTLVHWVMGWGNGYAEIIRNRLGQPIELWPVHPSLVTPELLDDNRTLVYRVRDPKTGRTRTLSSREMFHLRGLGNGIEGYSVIRYEAETLGLGLAAQRHAAAFFGEGMAKRAVILAKEKMSPDGRAGLRRRIQGDKEKDPVGARQLPIADGAESFDIKEFGINPKDAQFIESMEFFGVADVSRITGCPLWLLSSDKTAKGWSSYDMSYQAYIDGTLVHHTETIRGEGRLKLLSEREGRTHKIVTDFNSLMRANSEMRANYLEKEWRAGRLTRNEGRELNDRNPVEDDPNADRYYITADLIRADEEAAPAPEATIDTPPASDEDRAEDFRQAAAALRPVFLDAADRLARKEHHVLAAAARKHAGDAEAYAAKADAFYADFAQQIGAAFSAADMALVGLAQRRGLPGGHWPESSLEVERIGPDSTPEARARELGDQVFSMAVEHCIGGAP